MAVAFARGPELTAPPLRPPYRGHRGGLRLEFRGVNFEE